MGDVLRGAGMGGRPGRALQNADLNKIAGPVSVAIARMGTLSSPVDRG